jgi:hypothetical protein
LRGLWVFLLLIEGVRYASHAQGVQLLDRLLVEHWFSFGNY